jgi:dTMP kinase
MQPCFLTLEGIDFSGKSTQCRHIIRWFEERGAPYLLVREPGGTPVSEAIRTLLLDPSHAGMTPATELFLFSAARAQLVADRIRPSLAEGVSVIADRFFDSTTAYQGYGRGIDLDAIYRIHALATAGLEPHLTLCYDVPWEVSLARRSARGGVIDRMEAADRAFFERVREGYHALAERFPHRFVVIDGSGDEATVAHTTLSLLETHCARQAATA